MADKRTAECQFDRWNFSKPKCYHAECLEYQDMFNKYREERSLYEIKRDKIRKEIDSLLDKEKKDHKQHTEMISDFYVRYRKNKEIVTELENILENIPRVSIIYDNPRYVELEKIFEKISSQNRNTMLSDTSSDDDSD